MQKKTTYFLSGLNEEVRRALPPILVGGIELN